MPPRKRRLRHDSDDDDKFETDAFSFMNDKNDEKPNKSNLDDESDADLSGADESDVEDKLLKENEDEEADDSDEAPDDIGFGDSRQSVLSQLRTAMKQIDSAKQKKKDKRKHLDAQFKEQKAKKLEELAKYRLPDDVLEGLEEQIPKKKKKTKEQKKKETLEEDMLLEDTEDTVGNASHPAGDLGDDYIALTDSASGVQVAELKAVKKKSKSMAQTAADFRHNRLYGSHVRRESNKERLAKAEKRRQRFR